MNLRDEFYTIAARVFSIALMFGAAPNAFGQASNVIEIPAAITFPATRSGLDKAVAQTIGKAVERGVAFDQAVEDIVIKDPFEISLSGVRLKGNLRGRTSVDSKGAMVEAFVEQFQITIEQISIHTFIETRLSGVDARIRLDADCEATKISWNATPIPFFVRAQILTDGEFPKVDLASLTLSALVQRPEMVMACRGPAGVESMVRDQAWTALIDRWTQQEFLNQIETSVESDINDSLKLGGAGLALFNADSISGRLRPIAFEKTASGHHLRGFIQLTLDRPVTARLSPGQMQYVLPSGAVDQLTISVSTNGLAAVMRSYFAPGIWSEWIEGRDIEGFRDLMSSRFSQFFAFPDLMNYDKDAPFVFVASTTTNPFLTCAREGNGGRLRLAAPVGAWLLLRTTEREMGVKPLVYFRLPMEFNLVKNVGELPRADLRSIGLEAEFDRRYVETENPNTSIATDLILDRVRPSLETEVSKFITSSQFIAATVGFGITCDASSQTVRIVSP